MAQRNTFDRTRTSNEEFGVEKFLTLRAAAEALGVPQYSVRRAVKSGHFRSYNLGSKRIRVRLTEVVAAVERLQPTQPRP